MNCVCVIHHTLLIALFAFSFLHYFSNFGTYAYIALVLQLNLVAYTMHISATHRLTYNNANVEKYQIPIPISRYFEMPMTNTEPT